jgi:hypothetical protein
MRTIHPLGFALCLSLAALAAPLGAQETSAASAPAPAAASSAQPAAARRDRNALSTDEIRTASQNSMYEVIRSQRPAWLRQRGDNSISANGTVKVYMDNVLLGESNELRSIDPRNVTGAQFLSPQDATTRFGAGHTRGAILLSTR